MKTLLSTTALVVTLGFPAWTLAQTTAPAANPEARQQNAEMSGFLSARGQSDLFASELMGHDVYARRSPSEMTGTDGQATMSADGTHDMATMNRTDLDDMDNIGQINEIVLSNDGQVRALVIGVGGFLGMGEQDVAVTMDQVTFTSDVDDRSQAYIIVNTGADMLKGSPAYDRTAAMTGAADGSGDTRTDRTAFAAPQMQRDGYDRVEAIEVSADMLMGKSVYDTSDNNVGTVTDMIIDDAGTITNVIIDFGGFLGIGTSQASISFDELTVMSNDGYADVRLYVDATKDQIQNLPRHQVTN